MPTISRDLRTFLIATFAINWLLALAYFLSPLDYDGYSAMIFAMAYMLVPGIVAIVIDRRAGRKVMSSLWMRFRPNWWWLFAWVIGPVLAIAALVAALLIPGIGFDPGMEAMLLEIETALGDQEGADEAREFIEQFPPWVFMLIQLGQVLVAGATINAVFGLGEELGWRGLMLRELVDQRFWKSAGYIGVVWGIWHAPLILQGHNYPEHPIVGVAMMVVFCVLLSPLFSWVTIKCKSVIAAAIFHGTLNASAGLSMIYLDEFIPLITGIHGLVGMAVLVVANLLLWWLAKPRFDESVDLPFP